MNETSPAPTPAGDLLAARVPAVEVESFVRAELPALTGYCARLVGDLDLAGEVAQEALVRTWGRWVRVRDPRAYAYRVATHQAFHVLAEQRRTALPAVDRPGDRREVDAIEVRDAVARLPQRLRVVVTLHYLADLPVQEGARAIRRPVGTVKQRLYEARRLLAVTLEDDLS